MTAVSDPLGIVELVGVCQTMRERNERLFRRLGAIVTGGTAGSDGRLLAEACHRHAWHAKLWAARCPTIPINGSGGSSRAADAVAGDDAGEVYRHELDALRAYVEGLRERIDRELDPSSARVVDLVRADLAALHERLVDRP